MSLLWRTAIRRTAAWGDDWAPKDYEEDAHPEEIDSRHVRDELNSKHINRLADSIRQHGYSPERHGMLGWNFSDGGENVYHHSSGTETDPEDHLHHEHLLHALRDVGHGPVRVHIHDQSSTDQGNAPKLYHGTNAEDLEEVRPNHGSRGMHGNNGMIHEPGYAYATDRDSAESYAESVAMTHGGRPHVYRVHPLGPIEKDPTYDAQGRHRSNYEADVRSKHGFLVHSEEDLGHDPDLWDDDHDDDDEYGHGNW